MGITKEILIFALIYLILILLLLFTFIFVGIAAFAIPGTFGSIINSLFPVGKNMNCYFLVGGSGAAKVKGQS
jgi:hypothetical protein